MPNWSDPRRGSRVHHRPNAAQQRTALKRGGLIAAGADPSGWFETVAPKLLEQGWPIYPERHSGKRMPAIAFGRTIRPVVDHKMDRKLPSTELVAGWCGESETFVANSALMTGDAAGVFVLDCDIYDQATVDLVLAIADETLGRSGFMRVCNAPKFALVYRRPAGKLQLPAKTFELAAKHGDKTQQIEIKDGSALTIYGNHNDTGLPFRWVRELSPLTARPQDAPEATEADVLLFLRRVHAAVTLNRFEKLTARPRDAVEFEDTDIPDLRQPKMRDDLVPDKGLHTANRRSGFLLPRSASWVVWNAGIVAPVGAAGTRAVSEGGCRIVARAMAEEARAYIALGCQRGDDLTDNTLERVCLGMIRSAAVKVGTDFQPVGSTRVCKPVEGKPLPASRQHVLQTDAEFSYLPPPDKRMRVNGLTLSDPDPSKAVTLSLSDERPELQRRVSRDVKRAIDDWLLAVSGWNPEGNEPPPTLLLKAPTGAGKTTALLEGIARWKREYPERPLGPILMLLPSYANISELEGREDLGVWTEATEGRAAEIVELAGGQGLKVMTFRGKIAAGCLEHEKVAALMSKGISSSGLCYAKRERDLGDGKSETVETWCRFNPDNPTFDTSLPACANILQRRQVPTADLVLAPHAFIHTNVPKALKGVTAVVVDEKIWDKVIGTTTVPFDTFDRPRSVPPRTKKEWLADKNGDNVHYLDYRAAAAQVVVEALRKRVDPAAALLDYTKNYGRDFSIDGESLLEATLAVTGRTQRDALEIEPGMSLGAVQEIVARPKGEKLAEEHRFWTILAERMNAIKTDRANGRGAKSIAMGATDSRLKFLADEVGDTIEESAGVSWRRRKNFDDKPLMFLDASGNLDVLRKLWARPIVEKIIEAQPHMRIIWVPDASYSKTSLLPKATDEVEALKVKAIRRTLLRDALYAVSSYYGFGGVVACSPLAVRTYLHDAWPAPHNLDVMHFGATRGPDWAKHHVAPVSIGSINLSNRETDAIVAALTYDDDAPEMPIDVYGNGRHGLTFADDRISSHKVTREVLLRDGGIAKIEGVAEPQQPWAKLVQAQVREEELAQFGGRLRSVYRDGRPPVWIVIGKVLPAGAVVDEIVSLQDLARPFGRSVRPLEAGRMSGGVISAHATIHPSFEVASDAAIARMADTFATNPRLSEGFHEVSFRPEGQRQELHAWVHAAEPGDPVEAVRSRFPFQIAEAWLTREARMVPFERPRGVHPVDVILGTRDERADEERQAHARLLEQTFNGSVVFDEKRLGITFRGITVDVDTWITLEAMLTTKTQYEESAVKTTYVPNDAPATLRWTAEAGLEWGPATNSNVPQPALEGNVVPLQRPAKRGFSSLSRAAGASAR